jgi:signal transduction histidine kinase
MTADLALRKDRSPAEYREMIQDCQASAKQINQTIERLLTLARLDSGVALYRPQPVDVAERSRTVCRSGPSTRRSFGTWPNRDS